MKNKIVWKLTVCFGEILCISFVIISIVFSILFRQHTICIYQFDLEQMTITISETISDLELGFQTDLSEVLGANKRFLYFLDKLSLADIWRFYI